MKTILKFILCMLAFTTGVSEVQADDTLVVIGFKKRPLPGSVGSGGFGNAPLHLPIETSFDNATGVLSVAAPEDLEGYVYVYDITGGLETTSPRLNCTLTLPQTSDMHVISLQGESWTGEAKIIY